MCLFDSVLYAPDAQAAAERSPPNLINLIDEICYRGRWNVFVRADRVAVRVVMWTMLWRVGCGVQHDGGQESGAGGLAPTHINVL